MSMPDESCTYQAHAGGDKQDKLSSRHCMLTRLEDGTGLPGEADMEDLRDSTRARIARSCLKRAIFRARCVPASSLRSVASSLMGMLLGSSAYWCKLARNLQMASFQGPVTTVVVQYNPDGVGMGCNPYRFNSCCCQVHIWPASIRPL